MRDPGPHCTLRLENLHIRDRIIRRTCVLPPLPPALGWAHAPHPRHRIALAAMFTLWVGGIRSGLAVGDLAGPGRAAAPGRRRRPRPRIRPRPQVETGGSLREEVMRKYVLLLFGAVVISPISSMAAIYFIDPYMYAAIISIVECSCVVIGGFPNTFVWYIFHAV